MNERTTITLPQPEEINRREKEDAMGAYFMMFAAWGIGLPFPFLNLIAAIIYYGLHRGKSQFVAFHALQSLTSQFPVTVVNAGLLFWILRTIVKELSYSQEFWAYTAFAIVLNLAYIITSLVALTRAYKGNFFYFPIFGRWAFNRWYGPNSSPREDVPTKPNLPPR